MQLLNKSRAAPLTIHIPKPILAKVCEATPGMGSHMPGMSAYNFGPAFDIRRNMLLHPAPFPFQSMPRTYLHLPHTGQQSMPGSKAPSAPPPPRPTEGRSEGGGGQRPGGVPLRPWELEFQHYARDVPHDALVAQVKAANLSPLSFAATEDPETTAMRNYGVMPQRDPRAAPPPHPMYAHMLAATDIGAPGHMFPDGPFTSSPYGMYPMANPYLFNPQYMVQHK